MLITDILRRRRRESTKDRRKIILPIDRSHGCYDSYHVLLGNHSVTISVAEESHSVLDHVGPLLTHLELNLYRKENQWISQSTSSRMWDAVLSPFAGEIILIDICSSARSFLSSKTFTGSCSLSESEGNLKRIIVWLGGNQIIFSTLIESGWLSFLMAKTADADRTKWNYFKIDHWRTANADGDAVSHVGPDGQKKGFDWFLWIIIEWLWLVW